MPRPVAGDNVHVIYMYTVSTKHYVHKQIKFLNDILETKFLLNVVVGEIIFCSACSI